MPLPRMTTRRWMIAVAVAGALFSIGLTLYRRSMRFQTLAASYAARKQHPWDGEWPEIGYPDLPAFATDADEHRKVADGYRREQVKAQQALEAEQGTGQPTTQQERREPWYWGIRAEEEEWECRRKLALLAFYKQRLDYLADMRRRCERAATFRWNSVTIDPEPPTIFTFPEKRISDPPP